MMTFLIGYAIVSFIIGLIISFLLWERDLAPIDIGTFLGCAAGFGLVWPLMVLVHLFD